MLLNSRPKPGNSASKADSSPKGLQPEPRSGGGPRNADVARHAAIGWAPIWRESEWAPLSRGGVAGIRARFVLSFAELRTVP